MTIPTLSMFIPDEWLPVILMGAGLARIIGARTISGAMTTFVAASLILPPLVTPMLQMVPTWVLWPLVVYVGLMVPFAAVSALQALVTPALGSRAASEAAGHWAADVGRVMIAAPFKLVGALLRVIANVYRK